MPLVARVVPMQHDKDPKEVIWQEIGPYLDKTGLRALGADILIAVYSRAGQQTAGGIYVPTSYREDDFQGITGLIIDIGPLCCEEHSPGYDAWFGDNKPKVGDWIGFNIRDGISLRLGERAMRLSEWKYLRLR